MKKLIFLIAIVFLMSGCETTNPLKSQAQYEQDNISSQVDSTVMNLRACYGEAKKDTQVQKFYNEIFYELDTSPNKFTIITNKEYINKDQAEALKQTLLIIYKCRQAAIAGLAGLPFQNTSLKYYNAIDLVYIKLLKGEITIGEANEEKQKSEAQRRTDWSNDVSEIDNRLRSMHNSEMEGRREASMQQQQNQYNLRMQQNMLNQQQMNNIFNDLLRPPIKTNCTTSGNQTSCSTR